MYRIQYYLLLLFIIKLQLIAGEKKNCPNGSKNEVPTLRLKNDLMCNYDKTIRPVLNHQNVTRILLRMILKYFEYSEHSNSFSIDSWLAMYWKDEHLKWNPDNYESLKMIHLTESEIWMPDLSIYNRDSSSYSPAVVTEATCIVYNNGQVICVPPTRQASLCVADLTHFPFDSQNCTIRMGSWVHTGEEINITLSIPAVSVEDLVPNGEWILQTMNVFKHPGQYKCCPNSTYPSINFSFGITRSGGIYIAGIFVPSITLIILTLASLCLHATSSERFALCALNTLCHFLFLQCLFWMVPLYNGSKVPLILCFVRDSLLMAGFTLLLSIFLKRKTDAVSNDNSKWLSGTVEFVCNHKMLQFILLGDESIQKIAVLKRNDDVTTIIENTEVNIPSKQQFWIPMAKIIDRICISIFVIIYTSMLIAFMP